MTNGDLYAQASQYIGRYGMGTFTQTGGTNTVEGYVYLGNQPGSDGMYVLSGDGQLSANYQSVGYYGTGTFSQTGGTNTVTETLTVGGYVAGADGTYQLGGNGSLIVGGDVLNDPVGLLGGVPDHS